MVLCTLFIHINIIHVPFRQKIHQIWTEYYSEHNVCDRLSWGLNRGRTSDCPSHEPLRYYCIGGGGGDWWLQWLVGFNIQSIHAFTIHILFRYIFYKVSELHFYADALISNSTNYYLIYQQYARRI